MDFLETALETATEGGLWFGEATIFFREPALPTGFPDLVAVVPRQQELLVKPERFALGSEHLQLLHYIFSARSTSISAAADALLWSERSLKTMVEELESAELIRRSPRRVRCAALKEVFVAKRIIAIEAKIDKWEEAIRQAVGNTWFASDSFILLPDKRWSEEVREAATRFGIGVFTHDGTQTRVRMRAQSRRIPASYGSWLVNEWAIRRTGYVLT